MSPCLELNGTVQFCSSIQIAIVAGNKSIEKYTRLALEISVVYRVSIIVEYPRRCEEP